MSYTDEEVQCLQVYMKSTDFNELKTAMECVKNGQPLTNLLGYTNLTKSAGMVLGRYLDEYKNKKKVSQSASFIDTAIAKHLEDLLGAKYQEYMTLKPLFDNNQLTPENFKRFNQVSMDYQLALVNLQTSSNYKYWQCVSKIEEIIQDTINPNYKEFNMENIKALGCVVKARIDGYEADIIHLSFNQERTKNMKSRIGKLTDLYSDIKALEKTDNVEIYRKKEEKGGSKKSTHQQISDVVRDEWKDFGFKDSLLNDDFIKDNKASLDFIKSNGSGELNAADTINGILHIKHLDTELVKYVRAIHCYGMGKLVANLMEIAKDKVNFNTEQEVQKLKEKMNSIPESLKEEHTTTTSTSSNSITKEQYVEILKLANCMGVRWDIPIKELSRYYHLYLTLGCYDKMVIDINSGAFSFNPTPYNFKHYHTKIDKAIRGLKVTDDKTNKSKPHQKKPDLSEHFQSFDKYESDAYLCYAVGLFGRLSSFITNEKKRKAETIGIGTKRKQTKSNEPDTSGVNMLGIEDDDDMM